MAMYTISQKEVEEMIKVDIGDLCTHCGRDTSLGSGLFVGRIPSGREQVAIRLYADGRVLLDATDAPGVAVEGYMCHECQRVHPNPLDCDKCEKPTLDYHTVDSSVFCSDCCGWSAHD